jgi:hypothetical protein
MAQFDVHRNTGKRKDTIPCDQLGELVESLSHEGDRILAALDELLTQAWK